MYVVVVVACGGGGCMWWWQLHVVVVVVVCVVVVVACGAVVVVCYLSKDIRMPKRTADSHRSMTVSPYLGLISAVYSTAKHMHRGT